MNGKYPYIGTYKKTPRGNPLLSSYIVRRYRLAYENKTGHMPALYYKRTYNRSFLR